MGDDHALDFLNVIGSGRFRPFALGTDGVPFENARNAIDRGVTLACRQEIVLHGLQALTDRAAVFGRWHCAVLPALRGVLPGRLNGRAIPASDTRLIR